MATGPRRSGAAGDDAAPRAARVVADALREPLPSEYERDIAALEKLERGTTGAGTGEPMSPSPGMPHRLQLSLLNRDQRGVAMVEFLVVLLPVLLVALCTLELVRLSIAQLMLQRSAGIAVRACAVIKDQPLHCDANSSEENGQNPGQDDEIKLAANEALRPLTASALSITQVSCLTDKNAQGKQVDVGGYLQSQSVAQSGRDVVTVDARYHCVVPLAGAIVCRDGFFSGSQLNDGERVRSLRATATYGHQGARYDCWFGSPLKVEGGYAPPTGAELEDPWF